MKSKRFCFYIGSAFLINALLPVVANAAIALDRTRAVFDGDQKSLSLSVSNDNKQLPYLAQAWIEDSDGNKKNLPLTALPPVQRIEPGAHSQVKIQSLPTINSLPQDKESLYYFNLREIPPRSNKPNTLQLALQTRIKLFYRPASLKVNSTTKPWQEKITLTRIGSNYQVNNLTPYYVTLVASRNGINGAPDKSFSPVMISPKRSLVLKGINGANPVLTYINDYGGQPELMFHCNGVNCTATPVKQN